MPSCILCKSKNVTFIYKVAKYLYYQCENCLTLFLSPTPTKKELDLYYQNSFSYSAGATNESQIRKRAKVILSNLKHLHPTGERLLDIGSGFGYFLDEAQLIGLKPTGIEPSSKLSAVTVKYLTVTKNITFEEFYEQNKGKQKFDFITLIHVIEHVPNPKRFIKQAVDLLKPNGILFIETPNIDSHLFYAEKKSYTFLTPPDHIWIFSRESFKQITSKLKSISLTKLSTYTLQEHVMGILKKKLQVTNYKSQINNKYQIKNNKEIQTNARSFHYNDIMKWLKILIFDKVLASILLPLINFNHKGSVLELCYRKK